MIQESKICRKCGLEKPINKFRIRKEEESIG
jgi:ribosomal protein L40E